MTTTKEEFDGFYNNFDRWWNTNAEQIVICSTDGNFKQLEELDALDDITRPYVSYVEFFDSYLSILFTYKVYSSLVIHDSWDAEDFFTSSVDGNENSPADHYKAMEKASSLPEGSEERKAWFRLYESVKQQLDTAYDRLSSSYSRREINRAEDVRDNLEEKFRIMELTYYYLTGNHDS